MDWRGIIYDDGTPGGTRTPDLLLRRQLLYPAELLAYISRAKIEVQRSGSDLEEEEPRGTAEETAEAEGCRRF